MAAILAARAPRGWSVRDLGVLRRLRCRTRLAERADTALLQQRHHAQKHLGGHQRVAERRVPSHHADAEARGDGLETVAFSLRLDHLREQQRVEDGLVELYPD